MYYGFVEMISTSIAVKSYLGQQNGSTTGGRLKEDKL